MIFYVRSRFLLDFSKSVSEEDCDMISAEWDKNSSEVLISYAIHKATHKISEQDFARLSPGGWVSDEVVNTFCSLLEGETSQGYFFTSFLMSNLIKPNSDATVYPTPQTSPISIPGMEMWDGVRGGGEAYYDYNRVKRWVKCKADLFNGKMLFFPINSIGFSEWQTPSQKRSAFGIHRVKNQTTWNTSWQSSNIYSTLARTWRTTLERKKNGRSLIIQRSCQDSGIVTAAASSPCSGCTASSMERNWHQHHFPRIVLTQNIYGWGSPSFYGGIE